MECVPGELQQTRDRRRLARGSLGQDAILNAKKYEI
jgi:hypothetical protein